MSNYFEIAPEFIELDNRKFRTWNPVNLEQMTKKHKALFTEEFVRGKTVLDLGCCLGATGHWCLSAGAIKYIGVEVQEEYVNLGNRLLSKYHEDKGKIVQASIESFFEGNTQSFDIVCAMGIFYVFVDYYKILKDITKITKQSVVVDSIYPNTVKFGTDFCGVEFNETQVVNLATEISSLVGRGATISPRGLDFLMKDFGFTTEGIILPEKILEGKDIYNIELPSPEFVRYLMTFNRDVSTQGIKSLSEDLSGKKTGRRWDWIYI